MQRRHYRAQEMGSDMRSCLTPDAQQSSRHNRGHIEYAKDNHYLQGGSRFERQIPAAGTHSR